MRYLNFDAFLNEHFEKENSSIESFLKTMKSIPVKKGEMLLQQGEICKYCFYVKKGLLKYYAIDDDGKTHVLQFAPEQWFLADRESYFFNKASSFFIDAIEDSEILQLSYADFCIMSNGDPDFAVFNDRLLHRHIAQLQNRILLLISASVEERYQHFIKTYPELLLRVPQHLVASYLGVTPEGLSRVRKDLARKNFKSH
jgi:CRP-like cAMP-binding protein